jgi:hypothetical protein
MSRIRKNYYFLPVLTAALYLVSSCLRDIPDKPSEEVYPAEGVSFSLPKTICADDVSLMVEMKDDPLDKNYNSLGFLKMTFTSIRGVNIKKISLHDLGGNSLWGDFHIPSHADSLVYHQMTIDNGDNTVNLIFDKFISLDSSVKSIYFPVPPGSLDRGFSLVFYEYDPQKSDEVGRTYAFAQDVSRSTAVRRSEIVEMDIIDLSEQSEAYDVGARGYYKSLYIDAGVDLLDYFKASTLPFIDDLGLGSDYEYFAADTTLDNQIKAQNQCFDRTTADGLGWSDENGQLLYPDGEPRFRLIYVNGGLSKSHGRSFTKQALDNVNLFFKNGGSYIGTCAGSFMATTFYGSTRRYGNGDPSEDCSFGIWPGSLSPSRIPVTINEVTVGGVKYDGWGTVVTGMKVVSDKLVKYSFSEGEILQDTWHLGGCYMPMSAVNLSLTLTF